MQIRIVCLFKEHWFQGNSLLRFLSIPSQLTEYGNKTLLLRSCSPILVLAVFTNLTFPGHLSLTYIFYFSFRLIVVLSYFTRLIVMLGSRIRSNGARKRQLFPEFILMVNSHGNTHKAGVLSFKYCLESTESSTGTNSVKLSQANTNVILYYCSEVWLSHGTIKGNPQNLIRTPHFKALMTFIWTLKTKSE